MLNFEEYYDNASTAKTVAEDAFDAIIGNPINIRDADELIYVDPNTHEKIVFKRVKEDGK